MTNKEKEKLKKITDEIETKKKEIEAVGEKAKEAGADANVLAQELDTYVEELKDLQGQEVEQRSKVALEEAVQRESQAQKRRDAMPNSAFKPIVQRADEPTEEVRPTDSMEYRNAFMRFVQGEEKPDALRKILQRAGETTIMADIQSVIVPHTITNRIIEKMQSYGHIWSRITKTNYAAGLNVPTSDFGKDAEWVWDATNGTSEGKVADSRKKRNSLCKL